MKQVEHPDEVIVHVPERCFACGGDLDGAEVVSEEVRRCSTCLRWLFTSPSTTPAPALSLRGHERRPLSPRPERSGPVRARAAGAGDLFDLLSASALPARSATPGRLARDAGLDGTLQAIVERGGEDLEEFEVLIRDRLIGSAVPTSTTGARAEGALRWVHSASTGRLTLYRLHEGRGEEGIDHLGVLRPFKGVAVHDGWATYRNYEDATHALVQRPPPARAGGGN